MCIPKIVDLRVLAPFAITLGSVLLPMTSMRADSGCVNVHVARPLEWSFSTDWNLGKEGGLIFVDPIAGTLDRIDLAGVRTDLSSALDQGIEGTYRITGITTLSREKVYLLLDTPRSANQKSRMLFLSRDFKYAGESPVTGRSSSDGYKITRIYVWDVMEDERTVVALADLEKVSDDGPSDSSAIVTFSLEDDTFDVVERLPLDSPVRNLSRLRYPVLAAGENELVFMSLKGESDKFSLEFSLRRSEGRSRGSRSYIDLKNKIVSPTSISLRGIQETYEELSKEGFLSAVILWHERLFVVEVESTDQKLVPFQWVMREVDRRTGKVKGIFLLPATSPHIMVIPGDDNWAIVEKGRVMAFNLQLIDAFWIVPSSMIESRRNSNETVDQEILCDTAKRSR